MTEPRALPYELSTCLEWLFAEAGPDFGDRIRASVDAGLPAVEFWGWRKKDLTGVRRALSDTSATLVSFICDPPGRLVDPATHEEFLAGVGDSARVAADLGTPFLVAVAGNARPGVARDDQHRAVVEVLKRAADAVGNHDVTLILEPLNSRVDHIGTYLDSTAEGFRIIEEVGSPKVRLLYDAYHSLVMGEDPTSLLNRSTDLVGHIQIADAPGRGEPGSGAIDWAAQLATFRTAGYQGRIGLEYKPSTATVKSLEVIRRLAARA